MQFDNAFTALRTFINPFRDMFAEEFNKTGGPPPSSVIYRIDADGNDRISADGQDRITADSAYP